MWSAAALASGAACVFLPVFNAELAAAAFARHGVTHFFGSDDVQVTVSGRNLWLHTNYFGYDPESSNYGQQAITRNVDLGPYPPSRQFLFSLSVGF